jgi:acetyltransferase
LITKCFIDYDREIALVAEHADEQGAGIAGIVRLIRNHSGNKAEVALIIADEYQRRGLGTNLLRNIIEVAKREGIATLYGTMLWENSGMKDLFTKAGFHFARPEGGVASASLELT